jgi:hypothetical protein
VIGFPSVNLVVATRRDAQANAAMRRSAVDGCTVSTSSTRETPISSTSYLAWDANHRHEESFAATDRRGAQVSDRSC